MAFVYFTDKLVETEPGNRRSATRTPTVEAEDAEEARAALLDLGINSGAPYWDIPYWGGHPWEMD